MADTNPAGQNLSSPLPAGQPPKNHKKRYLAALAAILVVAIGLGAYFLVGSQLFKGLLGSQEGDYEALTECVTGIPEEGVFTDAEHQITVNEGCTVQFASHEGNAKFVYAKFDYQQHGSGYTVEFTGHTNLDNPSIEWDIDGTQTETGQAYNHLFAAAGSYEVKMRILGEVNGKTVELVNSKTVVVVEPEEEEEEEEEEPEGVDTSFECTPTEGQAPLEVTCMAEEYGPNYFWDFDDDSTPEAALAGATITHTYQNAGNYIVTYAFTDGNDAVIVSSTSPPIIVTEATPPPPPAPEKKLILHWSFDDGTGDDEGGVYNGTASNTTTLTGPDGNPKALYFNGTDSFVGLSNQSALNLNEFTYEAYVKFEGTRVKNSIIMKNSGNYGVNLFNSKNSGKIQFLVYGNNTNNKVVVESAKDFNDNLWHHVIAIKDKDNVSLYIDGKLEAQETNTVDPVYYETTYFAVGRNANETGPAYWLGGIDEVKIYNYALGADEIPDYEPRAGLDSPVLTAPKGEISDTTPTFEWSAVEGADKYYLVVWDEKINDGIYTGTNDDGDALIEEHSIKGTTFTTPTEVELPSGELLRYKVSAQGPGVGAPYSWSAEESFTIVAAPPCADELCGPAVEDGGGIDDKTVLMLHFDGDFTDSSQSNHTVQSDAIVSENNPKFGTGAGRFYGNEYLSLGASTDWNFGVEDWAIDYWVKITSVAESQTLVMISLSGRFIGTFFLEDELRFYLDGQYLETGHKPSANTWEHHAIVKHNDTIELYVDGVRTFVKYEVDDTIDAVAIFIGNSLDGYLDEFRVSKGVARWTEDFAPPTAPYTEPVAAAVENAWTSRMASLLYTDVFYSNLDGVPVLPANAFTAESDYTVKLITFDQPNENVVFVRFNGKQWDLDVKATAETPKEKKKDKKVSGKDEEPPKLEREKKKEEKKVEAGKDEEPPKLKRETKKDDVKGSGPLTITKLSAKVIDAEENPDPDNEGKIPLKFAYETTGSLSPADKLAWYLKDVDGSATLTYAESKKADNEPVITWYAPGEYSYKLAILDENGKLRDEKPGGQIIIVFKETGTPEPKVGTKDGETKEITITITPEVVVGDIEPIVIPIVIETTIVTKEITETVTVEGSGSGGGGGTNYPQCSDNQNNDDDGFIDFPADPGCNNADDNTESPDPVTRIITQCADGIDNDKNGFTDYPEDNGCINENDNTEETKLEIIASVEGLPETEIADTIIKANNCLSKTPQNKITTLEDIKADNPAGEMIGNLQKLAYSGNPIIVGRQIKDKYYFEENKPILRSEFFKLAAWPSCLAQSASAKGLWDTKKVKNYKDKEFDEKFWGYGIVNALTKLNMVEGYEDGTVGLANNITRAEILKLLLDAYALRIYLDGHDNIDFATYDKEAVLKEVFADSLAKYEKSPFPDMSEINKHWSYYYATIAYDRGLTRGIENLFNGDEFATRLEAATMVYNFFIANIEKQQAEAVEEVKEITFIRTFMSPRYGSF